MLNNPSQQKRLKVDNTFAYENILDSIYNDILIP